MKKLIFINILAVSFTACSSIIEPKPAILDEVVIVKMDSNWVKGLIVSPLILSADVEKTHYQTVLTYGDSLSLCNTQLSNLQYGDFAQKELDVLKFSPYILLNNDYAIIHWRWRYFFPFSSPLIYAMDTTIFSPIQSMVANCDFYYIETDSCHLNSLKQQWPLSLGKRIPQLKLRYITWKKLDEYRGDNEKHNPQIYENGLYIGYSVFHLTPEDLTSYVNKCDSLESIYVTTLNTMIDNNDLETWTGERIY